MGTDYARNGQVVGYSTGVNGATWANGFSVDNNVSLNKDTMQKRELSSPIYLVTREKGVKGEPDHMVGVVAVVEKVRTETRVGNHIEYHFETILHKVSSTALPGDVNKAKSVFAKILGSPKGSELLENPLIRLKTKATASKVFGDITKGTMPAFNSFSKISVLSETPEFDVRITSSRGKKVVDALLEESTNNPELEQHVKENFDSALTSKLERQYNLVLNSQKPAHLPR